MKCFVNCRWAIYIDGLYGPSTIVTIETGGCDSTTDVFLSHEARMIYKVDAANKSQFRVCRVNYYDIFWVLMENKIKVKLLSTPWRRIGVRGTEPHSFLTSVLDGGELSASRLCCSSPGKNPDTHRIVGWVGLKIGLDVLEKRKTSCLRRIRNPDRQARSLFSTPTTLFWLLVEGKGIDLDCSPDN